jgi:hypothetical protein
MEHSIEDAMAGKSVALGAGDTGDYIGGQNIGIARHRQRNMIGSPPDRRENWPHMKLSIEKGKLLLSAGISQ